MREKDLVIQLVDRRSAGRELAEHLREYAGRSDVTVLGLPRGGVPVAYEIAAALRAPLDVIVVRKVGVPMYPELAMGAIAGESVVVNHDVVRQMRVDRASFARVLAEEREELHRREAAYRGSRVPLRLAGRTIILVDDGLATGASMQAAILALEAQRVAAIVVVAPVATREAVEAIRREGHAVVVLDMPEPFDGVSRWYTDFTPTTDEEVIALLESR
ncbi:MAG: phosphoribosyltransferase [Gemmatimonadetes bacterium]|nr:phosphoribosyltransferase [Gemmatimonadota bacterium]